ncbi:MAG: hypothetical protein NTY77_19275, partial [Elusimicrobia bacterium]|nr:hypothetical protein [Elusimicrobiota bacterium]
GSGMGNSATQEGILGRAEANWCIKSAPHCVAKGLRTEFLREAQYLSLELSIVSPNLVSDRFYPAGRARAHEILDNGRPIGVSPVDPKSWRMS